MDAGTGTTTGPAQPPPGAGAVEIVESRPARVHRPLDLIRLTVRVGILLLLTGLTVVARDTSAGLSSDLARLLGHLPAGLGTALRLVSAFAALAVPLAMIVREIVWGYRRRLIAAVLTGLLAIGIVEGIDRLLSAFPASTLYAALTRVPGGATSQPLDTYLTALFAFAAVLGVGSAPRWRRLLTAVTAVYVVSAFTSMQASLESLVLSPVLGLVIGTAVRYLVGSVNERPDGRRIVAELGRRGIDVARLRAARAGAGRTARVPGDDARRRPAHRAGVRPRPDRLGCGLQRLPVPPAARRAGAFAGALPGAGDRAQLAAVAGGHGGRRRDAPARRGSALRPGHGRPRVRVGGRGAAAGPDRRPARRPLAQRRPRCTPATSPTAG